MKERLLLLCMIGLGLLGLDLIASAETVPDSSCAIDDDHPLIGETRWFGLYYEDTKIGHAESRWERDHANAGDRSPTISQRVSMTFKLEQSEETIEQRRRFDGRAPHRLLEGTYRSADRHITYRQHDGVLQLREGDLGRVWAGFDRDLCDEEDIAVYEFLKAAPPIGARLQTADFDVEQQVATRSTHELKAVGTRKILGVDHRFQTLRTTVSSAVFSYATEARFQNGEAVNLFLGPIELRAETEQVANRPNQGVDLFAEFEKPLNRPLERLSAIKTLTLKASIDDTITAIDEVLQDAYGQRVEYLDARTAIIELAQHPAPAKDAAPATYLRPSSSHPADHPRLIAIADRIKETIGHNADERALASALLDFVADYIETVPESPYAYHTSSVFDVLDNRTGDCTEHSQLFVTLARAAGLPAREVSGFVYGGDDRRPSLGGHAWVEVFIAGRWIGMDPTWQETELNRSHVQIENALVPSLTFEVLDITYR